MCLGLSRRAADADMFGSFRADWLYIDDTGAVDTWINQRGWGTGIVPNWIHPGVTAPGMKVPGVQGQIKFGRIYGSGLLDYVYLVNTTNTWDAYVWENTGSGGTKVKGICARYVDGSYALT
jgi:hypothetical protein